MESFLLGLAIGTAALILLPVAVVVFMFIYDVTLGR